MGLMGLTTWANTHSYTPTNIIRIRTESDQKYENKYDIGDIRPYPIRFHA